MTDIQTDIQKVREILGPDGEMERLMPGFCFRPEQLRIAEAVWRNIVNEEFLIAEAGTGVGKTFAYLVSAFLFVAASHEKMVISTRTKALQQQIIDRDIPQLVQVMKTPLKVAEAKGRENFLCWNKYINILAGKKHLNNGEISFMEAILTWAEATSTGDRKELNLSSDLMKYWPIVAADRYSCLKEQCRYHDKCFRIKMARNLEKADIIISNHALLLADMLVDNSILPEYKYLIIDEAHALVKEAFDKMALRFSADNIEDYLQRLYYREGFIQKGYLFYVRNQYPQLKELIDEIQRLIERELQLVQDIFAYLSFIKQESDNMLNSHTLDDNDLESEAMQDAMEKYWEWHSNNQLLIMKLKNLSEELDDDVALEINSVVFLLQESEEAAFKILEEDFARQEAIGWLEYEGAQVKSIASADINIGERLYQNLYCKLKSLVMISATLTIEDSFADFINRSGLSYLADEGRLTTQIEYSPFDYNSQAAMFIVEDMPEPNHRDFSGSVLNLLADLLSCIKGNTMILFTSRQQLLAASAYLRPLSLALGLDLIVQYEDGEFAHLINKFTSQNNSVLMGVETFWEGVDLKGDLLNLLIIVKLPFRSPTEPYCHAWEKYYRLKGMNSFKHFMLPDAALRFKQGVGRLIRSETDRGAVIVLDARLATKKYGPVFCRSVPFSNINKVKKQEIKECIHPWIINRDN